MKAFAVTHPNIPIITSLYVGEIKSEGLTRVLFVLLSKIGVNSSELKCRSFDISLNYYGTDQ